FHPGGQFFQQLARLPVIAEMLVAMGFVRKMEKGTLEQTLADQELMEGRQVLREEGSIDLRRGFRFGRPEQWPAIPFPCVYMNGVPDAPVEPEMRKFEVLDPALLRQLDETPDVTE